MNEEISDTIKDQEFEEAALAVIKSKHQHADQSEVVISSMDVQTESDIERKIIEDENTWKLKTLAEKNVAPALDENENKQPLRKETEQNEAVLPEMRKEKTIMASCNCGQIFSSTFSDEKNPAQGDIKIKAYDAKGSLLNTYSGIDSQENDYSAAGQGPKDYAKQA